MGQIDGSVQRLQRLRVISEALLPANILHVQRPKMNFPPSSLK
jgi:hypothetical protein